MASRRRVERDESAAEGFQMTEFTPLRSLIEKWRRLDQANESNIFEANAQGNMAALTGSVGRALTYRICADELEEVLRAGLASSRSPICPHCELPPVLPDVCTPEIHAVIEKNIARDWDLFHRGFDHAASRSPEGWQPIQTCPQNVTRALIYWPAFKWNDDLMQSDESTGDGLVAEGFRVGRNDWECDLITEHYEDEAGFGYGGPTHWMPLPKAPAGREPESR